MSRFQLQLLSLACSLVPPLVSGTDLKANGENGESGEPTGPLQSDNHLSVAWENDLYFRHDYYYTNGFQVALYHRQLSHSPVSRILFRGGQGEETRSMYGLRLAQKIYTPKDLAIDTISLGDHPYASTLTLTQESVVLVPERQLRILSGLQLGVLGPAALGFRTQEVAHLVSNPSRQPQGWEYQLRNDLVVNYNLRVEKGWMEWGPIGAGFTASGRLGTLHTDVEAGPWIRLDSKKRYFKNFGSAEGNAIQITGHLSATARHVFYDATLQGGVFNRTNPYYLAADELVRWIVIMDLSLGFSWHAHEISAYSQFATPRFQGADSHGWAGIAYAYWF